VLNCTSSNTYCAVCGSVALKGAAGFFLYPSDQSYVHFRAGSYLGRELDQMTWTHMLNARRKTWDKARRPHPGGETEDDFDLLLESLYKARGRARNDFRTLNRKLGLIAVGGIMTSARSGVAAGGGGPGDAAQAAQQRARKRGLPGAPVWKSQNNFLYAPKFLRLLQGHWAIARDSSQRKVPGKFTPREVKVLNWLFEHNELYRAFKPLLAAIPDVGDACEATIHVTMRDNGVIGVHSLLANGTDEEGRDYKEHIVFNCQNLAGTPWAGMKLDYTQGYPLKTLLMYPLLFPLGRYPQQNFFDFRLDEMLHQPDFLRMRGHLHGFVSRRCSSPTASASSPRLLTRRARTRAGEEKLSLARTCSLRVSRPSVARGGMRLRYIEGAARGTSSLP
jgi:hypothetical protein